MPGPGHSLTPRDQFRRFIRKTDAARPLLPADPARQPAQLTEPCTPLLAPLSALTIIPGTPTHPLLYLWNDNQRPLPTPHFDDMNSTYSMDSDSEPSQPIWSRYTSTLISDPQPPLPLLPHPTTMTHATLANTHTGVPMSQLASQ